MNGFLVFKLYFTWKYYSWSQDCKVCIESQPGQGTSKNCDLSLEGIYFFLVASVIL